MCWLALFAACSETVAEAYPLPSAPDYTDATAWYTAPAERGEAFADVFYVAPTCVWDWTDTDGTLYHFGDIYRADQREALRPSLELAAEIFGTDCDVYAPYYRQITLDSWIEGEDTVNRRFPYAMSDVRRAFDYYLAYLNNGRPFVLAGFSQGAKAVVELLKGMSVGAADKLVAAYVIGYRVTSDDLLQTDLIRAAGGADDVGVTICYNSVASPESMCAVLSPSVLCINPLNWRTDSVPAVLNDSVTVRVDTEHRVLLVEGFDSAAYYVPSLGSLFALGNYHLQELLFYRDALRENVSRRVAVFVQR